jgi:hypothetical protein
VRRIRLDLGRLLKATQKRKCEWRPRAWEKKADGTMVQEGKAECLPMRLEDVLPPTPDSPIEAQLEALATSVKAQVGAGVRSWVQYGNAAWLLRWDHGRPEMVDAVVNLPPPPPALDDTEDLFVELSPSGATLPAADSKGIVDVPVPSGMAVGGTRGDPEIEAERARLEHNMVPESRPTAGVVEIPS